jgi:hypothetical protein
MHSLVRWLVAVAALAIVGTLAGCSDSLISSRDDQHVPSVPPAQWEGNSMGLPTQNSGH